MDKEGLVRTAGFAAGYIVCAYAVGKLFTFALGNNNNNNSDQDDMRFRVDKDQRRKNNNKPPTNKKRRSSGANDNANTHGDGENGEEVGDDVLEDVNQQDELASLLNDHWAGEVPPELEEIIDILKYPEIYAKMGSSMPKGFESTILLPSSLRPVHTLIYEYYVLECCYMEIREQERHTLPRF
jgi:hypothetical protein